MRCRFCLTRPFRTTPWHSGARRSNFSLTKLSGDRGWGTHCARLTVLYCKEAVGLDSRPRFFRCVDCGEFLQCQECCIARHQLTPLHLLEEWTGDFWTATTLRQLGLVYQLGHQGRPCAVPVPAVRSMVVLDTNGIHRVSYRYCGCNQGRGVRNLSQLMRNAWYPASLTDPTTCATYKVLEMFRLMTVIGNVNARDFVTALERRTDALGPSGLNSAQTPFARMARQYAFLQRVRRAGRGHDPAGVDATKLGELAVMCWACPHEGRNLPEDWREVDPKYRFLFMLILALDANFKLKNRLRANERYDPSLGPGWGAFVEPTAYKEHLKNYISTCIAFAALLQKDTRLTTGLRTSGVGGCVCARHECVRPNGLGDLQKGERYANMDFIVMAAIAGLALMMVTISYDIACQWRKNLPQRMEKLPPAIRLDLTKTELQTGLPVWHASSHELECSNKNSLSFLPGVGKSDGEGVEHTWAVLNPAAFHTKEMGYGNRADALEDKIDAHNFLKNLGQAYAIRRKLVVAIAERARQVGAFKEVNKSVSKELRNAWQDDIAAFVADHDKPNPYVLARADGPTEAQIRVSLKKDEEEEARKGGSPLHGVSATAFLVAGLQLEEAQRRIKSEIAGHALVTADRESKIQERRLTFFSKYRKFQQATRDLHPGSCSRAARDPDAPPIATEKIQLFMPSELSAYEREHGCQRGIAAMEARLREAQCSDALIALRSHLHSKRHLITFRNKNVTGQVKATKSRTLIGAVGDKATAAANKYRQGRMALLKLKGADHAPHFRELKESDLTLDGEEATSETAARKKLSMLGAGKGARTPRHIAGSSRRVLSWIWTAPGALEDKEDELHECTSLVFYCSIRVEWCRAKVRKNRWEEEVELLREEARRVVHYLEWQVRWWNERSTVRETESEEMRGGLAAYAKKSAATFAMLARHFTQELGVPVEGTVRSIVLGDGEQGDDELDVGVLFAGTTEGVPATA
ncbi:hypothetical protein B0H11DRAFT_1716264 [Mycena galericulata]|nr:hypothetical protein B0H11DRAFT_1716264 [Mycena galericulata]